MVRPLLLAFLLLFIFLVSCRKPKDNNSLLLNFNLNNSFVIDNNDTISTPNGYLLDTNFGGYYYQVGKILFSDGLIGDSLRYSCSNWTFIENPTSIVEFWFPNSLIEDGIYNYSINNSTNDFEVRMKNNIVFDSTAWNRYNVIQSYNNIAQSSFGFINDEAYKVKTAVLEVKKYSNQQFEIKYYVETAGSTIVKGSYNGSLDSFKFYSPESDCD